MKLTLTVALYAILAGLAAVQFLPAISAYAAYVNVAIVFLGAVAAFLHAQGVDASPPQPPPSP